MKNFKFMRGAALTLVAILGIGSAQAATISGTLNFGGQAVATPGPGLGDATGLTFVDGFIATFSTGDLAAITIGTSGAISDFSFDSLPVNPLMTIGGFSFALQTVDVVDQQDMFLVLAGTGILSAAGFDDSAYSFSMSVDTAGGGAAFSGTLGPVPVPGALLLFISGLAALGVRRRD